MSSQPQGHTHWKCSKCGYHVDTPQPPEVCPQCREACEFKDITCYLPECGGVGNVDPRL
jgi:rubrerythrin